MATRRTRSHSAMLINKVEPGRTAEAGDGRGGPPRSLRVEMYLCHGEGIPPTDRHS